MRRLITITAFSLVLGFSNMSIAESRVFGMYVNVTGNTMQTVKEVNGSSVETELALLYPRPRNVADNKHDADYFKEIKLLSAKIGLHDLARLKLFENNKGNIEYNLSSVYSSIAQYQSRLITADDILSKVPSVSSEDHKTIGILVPPFGYVATKF